MPADNRRRRRLRKVVPGDGSRLQEYRFWHLLSRALFFARISDSVGASHVYAVDVRYFAGDVSDGEKQSPVALYRDGVQTHRADLPAALPVPGGLIDVATSTYGLTRMHHVPDGGSERVLQPHPRSGEGLRARFGQRFPRASTAIGVTAIVILLVGLVVGVPQALELVTRIDAVAERVGTFTSPIHLPEWANIGLFIAGVLAALERALTLRNHWLIDLDTSWSALG